MANAAASAQESDLEYLHCQCHLVLDWVIGLMVAAIAAGARAVAGVRTGTRACVNDERTVVVAVMGHDFVVVEVLHGCVRKCDSPATAD